MRRKSSRNSNARKSSEETKTDSPKMKTRPKGGKRSPSVSENESDTETKDPIDTAEQQEEIQAPNKIENDTEVADVMNSSSFEQSEAVEETQGEENEDDKGKSNDLVNSNVEKSWNNIEPVTENENVQGTAQSPSYDKDESIQNVTDNMEQEENNSSKNVEETVQENVEEANFESEYVQGNSQNLQEDNSIGERSTTPEIKDNIPRRKFLNSSEPEKPQKSDRKRITLRRSSPKEIEKRASTQEETESGQENKTIKRITLKRTTIEDRLSNHSDKEEVKDKVNLTSTILETIEKRRKANSGTTEVTQNGEDQQNMFQTKVKLVRNISLERSISESGKSKRNVTWGQSNNWLPNLWTTSYKIDVDEIKLVCPNVEFLKEDEVRLESVPKERRKSEGDLKRKFSTEKSEGEEDEDDEEEDEESSEEKPIRNENIIAMNRKISIVEDTASKMRPPPSPAKNPRSSVLFITNLVRPFTVKQLRELLERTGEILDDGFWTDRIKSKCYVQYTTEEDAEATRNALHGVNWPIGNGKQLVIDFSTVEDMDKAKNPTPPIVSINLDKPEKENREPDRLDKREQEERRKHSPIRQFDRSREEIRHRRSRSRSYERERTRKYSRRSYTPEVHFNKKSKKEEPVPQKLMDDLFLKTKATPSIYWQPLSPEEIALKQKQRQVRMEEHRRRIEETRERENRDRRMRDTRRPPFRRR